MSKRQSENDIDDIFRKGIKTEGTEPSEKFWRKAAENIIVRGENFNERKTSRWRTIVLILSAALLMLGYFSYKMMSGLKNVETQVTAMKNEQNKIENQPNTIAPTLASQKPETAESKEPLKNTSVGNNVNSQNTLSTLNNSSTNKLQNKPVPSIAYNQKKETIPAVNATQTSVPAVSIDNTGDKKENVTANPGNVNEQSSSGQPLVKNTMDNGQSNNAAGNSNNVKEQPSSPTQAVVQNTIDNSQSNNAADSLMGNKEIPAITTALDSISKIVVTPVSPLSKFSVSAFISPDFMLDYKFKNNNSWGTTQIVENQNFSYSAGIKAEYQLSSRFTISVGATYQKFSFNSNPGIIYAQKLSNGDVGYYLTTSSGVVDCPFYGGTKVGDSLKMSAVSSRVYLGMPVQLKYLFINKEKYNLYLNGGVETNICMSEKTTMSWQDFSKQQGVAAVNNTQGSSTLYFSYYIGIGASYNVSKYFSFFIEPGLNDAITSIDAFAPVVSYPRLLSINAGFTYHIK